MARSAQVSTGTKTSLSFQDGPVFTRVHRREGPAAPIQQAPTRNLLAYKFARFWALPLVGIVRAQVHGLRPGNAIAHDVLHPARGAPVSAKNGSLCCISTAIWALPLSPPFASLPPAPASTAASPSPPPAVGTGNRRRGESRAPRRRTVPACRLHRDVTKSGPAMARKNRRPLSQPVIRKSHALVDKVWREDFLLEAWGIVRLPTQSSSS